MSKENIIRLKIHHHPATILTSKYNKLWKRFRFLFTLTTPFYGIRALTTLTADGAFLSPRLRLRTGLTANRPNH